MAKILVLAEKPSVGKDIAKVLKCSQNHNGFIEGSKYIVTWALGHLVTLADPETYDEKYQSWRLEDLPMLPSPLKLEVIKQTRGQYNTVKKLMTRNDVSEIVIATDAGREGELVARWILEKVKVKKPLKRLWISSVTDKAISEGFANLKDAKQYEALYASAVARSEADWYVGMNATRALTCKFNAQLSCGRVQTPTLAMVGNREKEIMQFKPKTYYGLTAMTKGVYFTWVDAKSGQTRTFDKAVMTDIEKSLKGKGLTLTELNKKHKKTYAPGLYDLTELQRDANRLYGFSAKQTLNNMQKLYEHHKVLTYPRTDSKFLSSDIVPTLKDRVRACSVGEFAKLGAQINRSGISANKSFVDDAKVSDHHAIIPTDQLVDFRAFNSDERKIYDLVVKRFLAALMPPFEYEETQISAKIGEETFKAKGKRVIALGWKSVYTHSEETSEDGLNDQTLPVLNKGDKLDVYGLTIKEGKTAPPAYYTEGTLLAAMERPNKNMPCGIGTVATRADIIEKLFSSFLMEKRGNAIHITSKGKQLLELVPEALKTPDLTAEWESKLEKIAKRQLEKEGFIKEIVSYTKTAVSGIKQSDAKFKHDNMTREKCPDCGKFMLEVSGKKGKMLVCQDRECGHRKSLSVVTNARCPVCHKKMSLMGEGENKSFTCKCGHREKMEAFNKRRSEAKAQGSVKDVRKFLEEQKKSQKSDPNDSPFAILKKL